MGAENGRTLGRVQKNLPAVDVQSQAAARPGRDDAAPVTVRPVGDVGAAALFVALTVGVSEVELIAVLDGVQSLPARADESGVVPGAARPAGLGPERHDTGL